MEPNAGAHLLSDAAAGHGRGLLEVRCSARLCQNLLLPGYASARLCRRSALSLPDVLTCLAQGVLTALVRLAHARTRTSPRAAISRGIPTRFKPRLRLSAHTVQLNSVRTFANPRMKKSPASHHLFLVPHAGSTLCWRCRLP